MPPLRWTATRRSQTRWYFGVVGLIGGLALVMEATLPDQSVAMLVLSGLGLPIMLGYLGAAVAFPRLEQGPWLLRLAGAMALWALGLAVVVGAQSTPRSAFPVLLFVLVPALTVVMRIQDARG